MATPAHTRRGWTHRLGRIGARGLREPAVHFLLIALVVLGASSVWGFATESRVVRVGAEQTHALRRGFELRRGRAPTAEEARALVERYVDEEILVREALALGLDRDDVVIRRRLAQKMEFIARDLHPQPEPSDAELERYLTEHAARYAEPARLSFSHAFVSRDRDDARVELARLERALESGAAPGPHGDPFVAGDRFTLRSESEIAAVFGPGFARDAMQLETGSWAPLESVYGLHVVRVRAREGARTPRLDEVRARVRRDWLRDAGAETEQRERARLHARYRIEIEPGP